ncbi:uncharacterized protein BJX67DRAFT_379658 [Aspergillus lucknowensis]|uniref:Uncharacterized protein n=1 Tax=Aspergillus lucknowensis TaxID=176173 RepID=A0ABR4LZH5_9EURO
MPSSRGQGHSRGHNSFLEEFLRQHPEQIQTQTQTERQVSPSSLLYVQTDVTVEYYSESLHPGLQALRRIDHVFANVGIRPTSNLLEEVSEEHPGKGEWEEILAPPELRIINLNLLGVINTIRLGVYYLRRSCRRHGHGDSNRNTNTSALQSLVLTAPASSFQIFSAADYTVAKHGVLGILRGLVDDLQARAQSQTDGGARVRLNAIVPSWTATGIVPRDVLAAIGVAVQEPEVVARSVVMLFNDGRRHGEVLYSWGGEYAEIT